MKRWLILVLGWELLASGCTLLMPACGPAAASKIQQSPFQAAQDAMLNGCFRQASTLLDAAIEHQPGHLQALLLKARLQDRLGDYPAMWSAALKAMEQANSGSAEYTNALLFRSIAERRLGMTAQARRHAKKALKLATELGQTPAASAAALSLAILARQQGAMDLAEQTLQLADELAGPGRSRIRAQVLNQRAEFDRHHGRYEKARAGYHRALAIHRERADRSGEHRVLGNLCLVYENLNDFRTGLRYCEQALAYAKSIGDRYRQANNLTNMAGIFLRQQQLAKGERLQRQALSLRREIGDRFGIARSLSNLGELARLQGQIALAQEWLDAALAIRRSIVDWPGISASEMRLGDLFSDKRQYDLARSHYIRALALQYGIAQHPLQWRLWERLRANYLQGGDRKTALYCAWQAVAAIQSARESIRGLPDNLQISYLQDKLSVYRNLAALLIDSGQLLAANRVLDLLKEEEFIGYTRGQKIVVNDSADSIPSLPGELVNQEAELRESASSIIDLSESLLNLLVGNVSAADEQRLGEIEQELDDLYQLAFDYLHNIESHFAQSERRLASDAEDLQSLQVKIDDLPERTALLYYLVNDDKLRIMVVFETSPLIYREARVRASELKQTIFSFRQRLTNLDPGYEALGQQLYDLLIEPVREDLERLDVATLLLFVDDALRYLPFAALSDNGRYLVEDFHLSLYNSSARAHLDRIPETASWQIGAFGAAHYPNDLADELPAVPTELDTIVRVDSADTVGAFPGRVYLNERFTQRALKGELGQATTSVLHLASHFFLHPTSIDESYLLLGDGEKLHLGAFRKPSFPLRKIELLTLSACDTATGMQNGTGLEFESLASIAMKKGARSVLATLWPVNDLATAEWMRIFYARLRAVASTPISKVAALSEVQRRFIANTDAKAHPYYWAPFVLMGNTR